MRSFLGAFLFSTVLGCAKVELTQMEQTPDSQIVASQLSKSGAKFGIEDRKYDLTDSQIESISQEIAHCAIWDNESRSAIDLLFDEGEIIAVVFRSGFVDTLYVASRDVSRAEVILTNLKKNGLLPNLDIVTSGQWEGEK